MPKTTLITENIAFNSDESTKPPVDLLQNQLITQPKTRGKIEQRKDTAPFWEITSVIIVLLMLAVLKRFFLKKLVKYVNALTSSRFIGQLTREERESESLSVIFLELIYFMVIALFYNELYSYINPDFLLLGFEGFALFILVMLAAYMLKTVINNGIIWLLDSQSIMSDFHFFNFLTHSAIGVSLFPVVILLFFSYLSPSFLLTIGAVIITTLNLYRLFRMARKFWIDKRLTLKYFILYICGLEILPVLVVLKFASKAL